MSYNAANVHDLTLPMWVANPTGSNAFEPHPWGGVPGIFKQFTVQAASTTTSRSRRATRRRCAGHFLNSNPAGWELRENIAAKKWDRSCLQEQSDEALTKQPGLASNPDYFRAYANLIEDFVHSGPRSPTASATSSAAAPPRASRLTGRRRRPATPCASIPANPNAERGGQRVPVPDVGAPEPDQRPVHDRHRSGHRGDLVHHHARAVVLPDARGHDGRPAQRLCRLAASNPDFAGVRSRRPSRS
jgi:hypothetical protein